MDASELFLVRIWRGMAQPDRAAFRASVRRAGDEHAAFFTEPDELVRFIGTCVEPTGVTGQKKERGTQ